MNSEYDHLLTSAYVPGMLSPDRMMHPYERPDLTDTTYDYLFTPIKAGKVSLRHGAIIGLPECGKTEMVNDIAYHFRDFYGERNINIVFCDWLQDALDNMDNRPVQLLIVDDAVQKANSRKSGGNADDVADYFEIRHAFERKARSRTGVIVLIYISQRFKSLDIVFRNAMYIWFKTSTIDPDDRDIIVKYIGTQAYQDLKAISAKMYYHHNDQAKDSSIIYLPLEDKTGTFLSEMRPRIISMVGQREVKKVDEVFTLDRSVIAEQMMSEDDWKVQGRCWGLKQHGMKSETIAEDPIVMESKRSSGKKDANTPYSRQWIDDLIGQFTGELNNRSGHAYERWKAAQLTKLGLEVTWNNEQQSDIGKPDIVAVDQDGKVTVYSCKCMDFRRDIKMKRNAFSPEILEADRRNGQLIISVWNLYEMREQEITRDPRKVEEYVEIRLLSK